MMIQKDMKTFFRGDLTHGKKRQTTVILATTDQQSTSLSSSLNETKLFNDKTKKKKNNNNDDDDDDDDVIINSNSKVNLYKRQLQELARITSRNETAVKKAHELVNQILSNEPHLMSVELYNLLWEAYAYAAHLPNGAETISQQIKALEKARDDDSPSLLPGPVVEPNIESYSILMEAYTQRGQLEQVEAVVESIQSRQKKENHVQPNILIYNKLLRAYGILGQPEKAKQVVQTLLEQHERNKDNNGDNDNNDNPLRPNAKTWIHLLRALAEDSRVEEIQHYMSNVMTKGYQLYGYKDWQPNVYSYNALMRAIVKEQTGTADQVEPEKEDQVGGGGGSSSKHKRVEGLLYDMIQLDRETKHLVSDQQQQQQEDEYEEDEMFVGLRPNADTFLLVLQSFQGCTDPGVGDKVERLLELQRSLTTATNTATTAAAAAAARREDGRMLTRVYNTAILVLSRTRDAKKAIRAQRILNRLLEHEEETTRNNQDENVAKPDLTTYRNILNTCAFTKGPLQDRLAAFHVAMNVYNRFCRHQQQLQQQQQWVEPQEGQYYRTVSSIYQWFLQSCFHLMTPGRKRDAVVENVFTKCCLEGCLSDRILASISKHASHELQVRLLRSGSGSSGFSAVDAKNVPATLPAEWSRHVYYY